MKTIEEKRKFDRERKIRIRNKNPELYRQIQKRSRLKHREKRISESAKWYRNNKARQAKYMREYGRKYYLANKDKIKWKHRIWAKNNRTRLNARDAFRKASELKATLGNPVLIRRWMIEVKSKPFSRCHWCGTKVDGKEVEFDHVIALSRGGSHSIGNLCSSCPECNRSKSNRIIADWICNNQTFLTL